MIKLEEKIEKIERIEYDEVKTYSIEGLSEEDVKVLLVILYSIGGSPSTTYRKNIDKISAAIISNNMFNPTKQWRKKLVDNYYDPWCEWYVKISETMAKDSCLRFVDPK